MTISLYPIKLKLVVDKESIKRTVGVFNVSLMDLQRNPGISIELF